MDRFADERDHRLLDGDKYTFFVLDRVLDGDCRVLFTDHERLILCWTDEPHPVWIWTPDGAEEELMERAYRLTEESGLFRAGPRFNVKYELAEYFIRRAAADGRALRIYMNLLAYDCPVSIRPAHQADGGVHRCTADDLGTLADALALFQQETGVDEVGDREALCRIAEHHIAQGRTFFWLNGAGEPAATCKYGPKGALASINLVYTWPQHRRKHYAENLVYAVTEMARAEGCTPMLYTNADYAASNACYEKVGYVRRGALCTLTRTEG